MGGIIRDFLGGAAGAAADIGKMQFQQNLQNERDEANFLRDKELRDEDRRFRQSEREAGQTFTAEQDEKRAKALKESQDADRKARTQSADDDRTSRETIAEEDRESRERIAKMKPGKNPQLIKYTDSKGFEQEGILQQNTDGSYTIVKPDTGEVVEDAGFSRQQRQDMADLLNVEAGYDKDWIPFNEIAWNDPEVTKALTEGRGGKDATVAPGSDGNKEEPKADDTKKGEGVVSSQQSGPTKDNRTIAGAGGRRMNYNIFARLAKQANPSATDAQIKQAWEDTLKSQAPGGR